MAYNTVHNLDTVFLTSYSPSVGGTPVAAYTFAPIKGRLLAVDAVLQGALTVADCTVTIVNVTTGITWGTLTLTQSGSAAGSVFSSVSPTSYASSIANLNDVFSITPAGASGASIAATFRMGFRTF